MGRRIRPHAHAGKSKWSTDEVCRARPQPGRIHHLDGRSGVKAGFTHGQTDEMGYEIVKDPVEIRDLHATMLYLLGFDHHKLNYSFQGSGTEVDERETGACRVAEILA